MNVHGMCLPTRLYLINDTDVANRASLALVLLQQHAPTPLRSLVRLIRLYERAHNTHASFAQSLFHLYPSPTRTLSIRHISTRTAASEASSILQSRIAGSSVGSNVEETGRVLSAYTLSSLSKRNVTLTRMFPQASMTVLPTSGVSRTFRVCISARVCANKQ